jgi:hypothetical protein
MNTNTGTKTQKFTARGKTYTLLVKTDATGKKLYSECTGKVFGHVFHGNPQTACVTTALVEMKLLNADWDAAYEAHGEGKEYQAAKELYIAARERFSELQSLKRSEVFETAQSA